MTLSSRDVKSCVPTGDFSSRLRSHIPLNTATFNWEEEYGCIRINLTVPSKSAVPLDLICLPVLAPGTLILPQICPWSFSARMQSLWLGLLSI